MPEVVATLRIDAEPSGKRFQGVWLELPDGARWVIDYRPRACWLALADQEVVAVGAHYTPEGQAIRAPHFRVETLRVRDATSASVVALGPEQTWTGTVVEVQGAPGSKQEGTSWLVLRTAERDWRGTAALLAPHVGETVVVQGRGVEFSPYVARAADAELCVLSIRIL